MNQLLSIKKDFQKMKSVLLLNTLQKSKQTADIKKHLRNSHTEVVKLTLMIISKFLWLIDWAAQYLEQVSKNILIMWNIENVTQHNHDLNTEKYKNKTTNMQKDYDISLNEQLINCEVKKKC